MAKISISITAALIKKAKKIAKSRGTSVSKMVAYYFDSLGKSDKKDLKSEIGPIVKSMIGLIPDTGKTYREIREEYYEHIRRKGDK